MPKITAKGKGLKVTVESAEAQVSALSPVSSADSFVVVGASSSPSREPEPLIAFATVSFGSIADPHLCAERLPCEQGIPY